MNVWSDPVSVVPAGALPTGYQQVRPDERLFEVVCSECPVHSLPMGKHEANKKANAHRKDKHPVSVPHYGKLTYQLGVETP